MTYPRPWLRYAGWGAPPLRLNRRRGQAKAPASMVRLPLLLLAKLVQLRHEALEHGASLLAEPLAHLSSSSARFMALWKSPGLPSSIRCPCASSPTICRRVTLTFAPPAATLPTAQSNASERRNAPRQSEPAAKPLGSVRRRLRRHSRRKRRGRRAPDLMLRRPMPLALRIASRMTRRRRKHGLAFLSPVVYSSQLERLIC